MKRKWIELTEEWLTIFMNHCFVIALSASLLGLFLQRQISLLYWGGFIVVPFFLLAVRRYIRNFFLFYGLHLALPFAALLLPVPATVRVLSFIVILAYCIYSIFIKIKSDDEKDISLPPIVVLPSLGALMLFDNWQQNGLESHYLFLALLYVTLYFIYQFVTRYLYFMTINGISTANTMEQDIFTSGMKQTVLFTAIGIFILLLTCNFNWVSGMVSFLGNGLLKLLRAILTLFVSGKQDTTQEQTPNKTESMLPESMQAPGEPSIFAQILETCIVVLMYAVLITCILLLLRKIYRFLRAHFFSGRRADTGDMLSKRDVREKCTVERVLGHRKRHSLFLSNREKIRKLYRSRIWKQKWFLIGDENPRKLEYLTATECCDKLSDNALKYVYEKARYSSEKITGEDVKRAKKQATHKEIAYPNQPGADP